MTGTSNTLCCHWCGVNLSMAAKVTILNGNLPVCDLCLMRAKEIKDNQQNLDPKIAKLINEHFWEMT